MTRARQAVLIALAVSVSACGQDGAAEPPVVANVSLAVTNAALFSGDTTSALVTLSDANGRVLTGRAVTWQSSATTVATVSGTGSQATVTAVAPGTTVISASSDGATGSAAVVVNDRTSTLPVLTFSPGTVQFTRAGETQTVTLVSSGLDPSTVTYTGVSSNTQVATVSTSGAQPLITAGTSGTATITLVASGRHIGGSMVHLTFGVTVTVSVQ